MKKNVFIGLGLLLISGCVPLVVGAGLATGYTLSNDSAIGNIKGEYRILWDLCKDKMLFMEAEILSMDESKGIIKAVISENKIIVRIDVISPDVQKLRVSARKFLIPRPHFAQKVFLRIIEGLK
ncbi:MAG: hypothetical protein ABIH08_02665 [Candidatus Omnitrophota bacterium]